MNSTRLIKALGLCACISVLHACGGGASTEGNDAKADGETASNEVARKTEAPVVDPAIRQMYVAQCVTCHGVTGLGDGSMSAMLKIPPRSFVSDNWKFVLDSMSPDEQRSVVIGLIENGISEAMMPGYKETMTEEEIAGLADYVLSLREAD